VLAIVLIGQFMATLDASIVNVAIPVLHADLHASGSGLQLIVAGYTITYAVLLVTGARLGDILGHKRVFLTGAAAFTLASLGCGVAPNVGALVGLRFVQGAAAAVMIPQVLSLIQRTYTEPGPRAKAMSGYSTVLAGAAVVGQVLGGLLIAANIDNQTWRPIFLVNVPVGIVLLAVGTRVLPSTDRKDDRKLDLPGLAILTPAVLAFVLPLVLGQSLGWPAWGWVLLAASVLALIALPRVEGRVKQPILPEDLLRQRGIPSGIAGLFAVMAVFSGWFFVMALQLQDGLGESPLRAGLTFVPAASTFALVSLNWRRLPTRMHQALPATGFIVYAAGLVGLAFAVRHEGPWVYVLGGVAGAGMAAAFSPLMTRVLTRVPVRIAADASGVLVTVNQLAVVVGVAVFGTIYLNIVGHLGATSAAAHAATVTFLLLAACALAGSVLAALHHLATR
jgi:EmrB/QacA subfamily drug resistance transporter